jgi:hypothetical protein
MYKKLTFTGDFLVCALCSKNIRGELKMAAHMSKCHPDGQERAPCEYCGKVRVREARIEYCSVVDPVDP